MVERLWVYGSGFLVAVAEAADNKERLSNLNFSVVFHSYLAKLRSKWLLFHSILAGYLTNYWPNLQLCRS